MSQGSDALADRLEQGALAKFASALSEAEWTRAAADFTERTGRR